MFPFPFSAIQSAWAADLGYRQAVLTNRRMAQSKAIESFKRRHISQGAVGFAEVHEKLRPIYLGGSRIPKVKRIKPL